MSAFSPFRILVSFLLALVSIQTFAQEIHSPANRLTYLDQNDPLYVGVNFPKLTTPQWIGLEGVEAVVILAVDDMAETKRYEEFLRPILNRLKEIDGRAAVSIMTLGIPPGDEQAQRWLKEGLTLEVHTSKHPCPLLAGGTIEAGAATYHECIDLLSAIPGNKPVAFRMPCCDSMDSASPRFYAEIFNRVSPKGNFLTIDSSVVHRFTTNDLSLPKELTADEKGRGRLTKYFPAATNAVTKLGLGSFSTTIEDYPYPYVIGKLCWEFPCAAPSDWEAQNFHGRTNDETVADWKASLHATVLKKGVMTMVFHPHGWIMSKQMVDLVDYAAKKYGNRIKFLNFKEAQEALNKNLLAGEPLRAPDGSDNGVRLLDLNNDGFLDVVIGNERAHSTRVWDPKANQWLDSDLPMALPSLRNTQFGAIGTNSEPLIFFRDERDKGAWLFSSGLWNEETNFFAGVNLRGQPVLTRENDRDRGVRMRDLDKNGICEVLVANDTQNAVFGWSAKENSWKKLDYEFPGGASIVNRAGEDNGARFVDLNGDGYDDLLFSNQDGYGAFVFIAKPVGWLGWKIGWSYQLRAGKRGSPGEIPMIVRAGPYRNNGAWLKNGRMFVQNEDTASLPEHIRQISFEEIASGAEASAKSLQEGLKAFHARDGFKVELMASEPLIVDPVAIDWGPDGRMWVVEMRDYPLGMDGAGKPGGVVKYLEDTKGTGVYDKATVFLEGLRFPNGIMPWGKGVLISSAPEIIYAEDTDGDGKADVKKVLFTGFREGNQQHRINGFEYGLDNWVYLANGGSGGVVKSLLTGKEMDLRGHDLRIKPGDGSMELQPGATQFGRHRNDWGDWFGNDNGHWGWHYFLPEHYLARNARLTVDETVRHLANYENENRLFPICPGQQRFNWPDALKEVTSACSATPYRDEVFPEEFQHSLFICEPANCLVHREVLAEDGVSYTSQRAATEQNSEFLPSLDNWCRPVMAKTGPDGAVYVVDMYRKIIEHPEYFPEELKHQPGLRAGEDKGRIYRIYPAKAKLRTPPRLDGMNPKQLVRAMDSPNGWQRDTIQRLLVQGKQKSATEDLKRLLSKSSNPKVRLQALATLDGLGVVTSDLLRKALNDAHWAVRRHAVLLSEPLFEKDTALACKLVAMTADPDIRVRYQLAFSLGEWEGEGPTTALVALSKSDWTNEEMQVAILSSMNGRANAILKTVMKPKKSEPFPEGMVTRLLDAAAFEADEQGIIQLFRDVTEGNKGAISSQEAFAGLLDALDARKLTLPSILERPEAGSLSSSLEKIFTEARRTATNAAASESDRLLAIRLLGRDPAAREQDAEVFGALLAPQNPETIQKAALLGLRKDGHARAGAILLEHWRTSGPELRQEILNALLSRSAWTELLLKHVEDKVITPMELGTPAQQKLLKHSSEAIRKKAQELLAASNSDRQKVVEAYRVVTELKGDTAKGHELFVQNCTPCHLFKNEGKAVGPDLGTMATKPAQELVVAILDPNQAVDPAYTGYSVLTKDDRDLTGILIGETPNNIQLRLTGGTEETVLRSDIQEFKSSGRSLMPEGFETALKPQDMADLIAYILGAR